MVILYDFCGDLFVSLVCEDDDIVFAGISLN